MTFKKDIKCPLPSKEIIKSMCGISTIYVALFKMTSIDGLTEFKDRPTDKKLF